MTVMNAQVQQNAEWNYLPCTTSPDTPINHPTCRVSKCRHPSSALDPWRRSRVLFGFRGQSMHTPVDRSRYQDQSSDFIVRNVSAATLRKSIPLELQLSCTFQWAGSPKGTKAVCEQGDPLLLADSPRTRWVEIPDIGWESAAPWAWVAAQIRRSWLRLFPHLRGPSYGNQTCSTHRIPQLPGERHPKMETRTPFRATSVLPSRDRSAEMVSTSTRSQVQRM